MPQVHAKPLALGKLVQRLQCFELLPCMLLRAPHNKPWRLNEDMVHTYTQPGMVFSRPGFGGWVLDTADFGSKAALMELVRRRWNDPGACTSSDRIGRVWRLHVRGLPFPVRGRTEDEALVLALVQYERRNTTAKGTSP